MENTQTEPRYDLASINQGHSGARTWMVIGLFVVIGIAGAAAWHASLYGELSALYFILIAFTWINVMICFWEISMHLCITLIQKQNKQFVAQYRGRELDRVLDYFNAPMRLADVFKPSTWAEVWSSYSLFDEAYASRKSFGFWADTGNGYITLLPSLFFIYGLTTEAIPARILAMVGLALFWQVFYGTVIYFWAFVHNKQYVGHTKFNLALFIGGTNGLWLVAPVVGMAVCVAMILSGNYAVLH